MIRLVLVSLLFLGGLSLASPARADEPVRVTVVVILGSREKDDINPKLAALAQEIQKRDSKLIGFRIDTVLQKSIPVGEAHTFVLIDEKKLKVTVDKAKDKNGRIGLTLAPPGVDEIAYTCTCEKFFPVITEHKNKAGEQLIIAVMAKPCTGKGP
jgi:hypothetical protein